MNDIFSLPPWDTLIIFKQLSLQFKDDPLPDYVNYIAAGTSAYEEAIRQRWLEFKRDPTKENAKKYVDSLVEFSRTHWRDYMMDVLGVEDLTPAHEAALEEALNEHHEYLLHSLLPDLIKAIEAGATDFNNFDYRAIFLYAGALWSFGFLATIMFDGLQPRDAADIFLFVGPNDENTCEGERGCKQYVGKAYTVAEILVDQIIPGRLRCRTSCRHILIPVVSA